MVDVAEVLQLTCGWLSFFLWSASFYPQVWLNYKEKSVAGFSIEYAMTNPVGYYFYSLYNLQGLVSPAIGRTGSISLNDLVFGLHGFVLSMVCFGQSAIYSHGEQKRNSFFIVFLAAIFLIIFGDFVRELINPDLN